jgi:hypothetical protein
MNFFLKDIIFIKKNLYISFFFLIFFFVPNFIELKFYDNLINIKIKYIFIFILNLIIAQKFFNTNTVESYKIKNITYIYLIFLIIYISSALYYSLIVENNVFNKSYFFQEKFVFSFIYQFSLMNLIIYISINFNSNIFEIFNKILFYFSLFIILEFILIKILFFLNYNNLIFNKNFYEIFLASNPIVYFDAFYAQGRIFRSLFINDHLITSFILFMGFLSNLFIYEKNRNFIFIFLGFICLTLSFYNFESRLTILTNCIMLLIILFWIFLSKINLRYLLLILIIGYYFCIIFIKITCEIISFNFNFFDTVCKLDSLYDRFSLALFSMATWVTNPVTLGLELMNNFYSLNKYDLFLNNSYTSGDSYVTVTSLRNEKYAAWHGGEITYPHNFFVSTLASLGVIFPFLLYIFFKRINFKVSTLSQKYIFMMLVFALLNSLINKMFFIETYIFLFATLLFLSRNYEKE